MKKKIIIFHQNFNKGGVENSTIFLAENLKKNGYEITFASNFENKFDFTRLNKFDVKVFPYKRLRFNFFHILSYLFHVKKKYNNFLVISNQFNMNIFLLILKKILYFKIIIIERNHPHELNLKNYFSKKFYYFLIRKLYRNANYCIGISKKLSKDYSQIAKVNFITIYNFFDFKKIYKYSKKFKIIKDKSFDYNFIYIARLVERKRPFLAVDIIDEILKIKKKKYAKLTIIGEGNIEKELKNYIFKRKLTQNIKLKKFTSNHYPYYKSSDFIISTSKFEGFCNILVESISLNCLPICYDYPSGPSEILLNGKGGIIFKTLDPNLIAKNIVDKIENKNMIKNKLEISKKHLWRFDHRKNFKEYLQLVNKLLK
ncbi:glycosyltransferase [Candidatus Pelagibacter sp. HIMB1709]|uniref:glycosyltransferase n=1 Tax=Candidatus Pelagibacter sp. HIMB1709 TaxID=3413367 RepID=UPI003F835366